MFCTVVYLFLFFMMSSVIPEAELDADFHEDVFMQEDYHYLNVPKLGTYSMYDTFECTLKCLRNPPCFSVNLAASKGADGKLWCELLSSKKDGNPEEYKENRTSHHFNSIQKSLCMSTPCQNGGTCVPNYKYYTFDCRCRESFIGEYCEIGVKSCQSLYEHDGHKLNGSQVVTLILDSKPTSVLCHMGDFGCGDGGWTPVMKMNGIKQTFHYNSNLWSNKEIFNLDGGKTGFDAQETKLPTYWNTSFSKICLGMKIGQQIKFIVINKQANSLHSLIADGQYRATSLGRDTWKSLIGSEASLQYNCNKEGFNAMGGSSGLSKARIGILGDEGNDCGTCDSRIGFGTGGDPDDNTCGNKANHSPDNGVKHIKGVGYILVH